MVKDIDIALIRPYPENSNRMDADTLTKLRRNIERTGRYEPLVVRPHPAQPDHFQVINGHHRLQVLKAIGHTRANCVVWNVNDDQARLYLATLNRLSGKDVPERRALLIGNLLESFALDDLADLLPDSRDQLAELERLANVELEDFLPAPHAGEERTPRIILEFFLDQDRAKVVNLALDLITHRCPDMAARSDALVQLARCYLAANASDACGSATTDNKSRAD